MKQGFDRRIFTARALLGDFGFLFGHTPQIIGAFRDKRISRATIEKIMTVTTAVNGCRYCSWFHARRAVESGISEEEVRNLLGLQFRTDGEGFDVMALLYAQHFAETDERPDPEMTKKLIDCYGEGMADHIILFIRMISFGNLLGNTWDAFLSRLKGDPAENSSLMFELSFFMLSFWFMLPAMFLVNETLTNGHTP
jgi:AhpD family alkylhydroperoxidase